MRTERLIAVQVDGGKADGDGWPSFSPPVEVTGWEGDPWVSEDGHHIVFVSDRVTGVSRINEAWR